ncbi:MAG: type VI secretion lipoprotein TssJ [Desulfatitalea sp.]|nr:type VI secretion lipoprotein TssJ [Desulfatitalea sp.]
MKWMIRFLIVFVILLSGSGCAPVIIKPHWGFEKEAVRIHVRADHRLNMYNGRAHTLYICIYQLKTPNGLDQLAQDQDGIRQLLECRLFDDSVAVASSKVIHAGEHLTMIMDRAEKARHLAIVAGYSAGLIGDRVVRRHAFQSGKHKEGYFKKEYRCLPCELNVELMLGPYQIENSHIMPNQPECSDECE